MPSEATTLKQFKFKDKTFFFKKPLKITIREYLANDLKTICTEVLFPDINDGYSTYGTIEKKDKAIRDFLNDIFENYLIKDDKELSKDEVKYKERVIKVIDTSKTKS